MLKEYLRLLLQTQEQTIGAISVSFNVKGTRKQYIDFLDYIASLEKATRIDTCVIMYTEAAGEAGEDGAAPEVNGTKMTEFGNQNIVKLTDTSEIETSINMTFYSVIPPQFGSETEAAEATPAA